MDSTDVGRQNKSNWQLLSAIGILWLLLGAALLIYWQRSSPRVEITWETATEQGTVGFNVYRSDDAAGEFVLVNEEEFIESRGSAVSGAEYSYTDNDVEAGQTYYYVLEEIESDGSRRRYGDDLFEYQVPDNSWWTGVLAIICAGMGIAMLYAGVKEGRKK